MGEIHLYVLAYVDNLIIASNNISTMIIFKANVFLAFIWSLKIFLGLEIVRNLEGIYPCQWKHALEFIEDISLLGAKLVDSNNVISLLGD